MISGAVKGLRSFIHVFGVLVSSNDILQSTNRIQESKIFFSQLPANIFSKAGPDSLDWEKIVSKVKTFGSELFILPLAHH